MKNTYLKDLIEKILSLENYSEVKIFLEGILTPKEQEEIITRLQIVKLLKKGMPQQEIAKKLGVGIATVTRGSLEIKKGHFKNI